jgi:hypothetical protein
MAAIVTSPQFSFVRFSPDEESTCDMPKEYCLPIIEETDVAFQFIIETDTEAEANELCDIGNNKVKVGITKNNATLWIDNITTRLNLKPDRYRIGPRKVLFNWPHGLPDFTDYIDAHECFQIAVAVQLAAGTSYGFSNCFQRIISDCYTSVIEYGSAKNAFGFVYCGYFEDDEVLNGGDSECAATVIPFSNVATLSIAYTNAMIANYGDLPTVEVYIYDASTGTFIKTIVQITFDALPPTTIAID